MRAEPVGLEQWVEHLGAMDIPVLARTLAALGELMRPGAEPDAWQISEVILHDVLFTLRVLRDLQQRHRSRWTVEITTVEHAILMLGTEPFFARYAELRSLESALEGGDLEGAMRVLWRAYHAAMYARDWAAVRADLQCDELAAASLLHETVEAMLWCCAPGRAREILTLGAKVHGGAPSAQRQVLGFTYRDLLQRLAKEWQIPRELQRLMFDQSPEHTRSRLVEFANALAAATSAGWEGELVQQIFGHVSEHIGLSPGLVRDRSHAVATKAGAAADWFGSIQAPGSLPGSADARQGQAGLV